ncbi:MAG: hypothetical protein L3J05_07335, partial [Robiginitomaculum sp.]|nr:hypothetical protein [Robiginitomaculum sp.]
MTKTYYILLGWGLAATVVLATVFGLPKLAGASTDFKDQAKWQARASNLHNVGLEYYSTSNLAKSLAEQHLDVSITNPYMLDYKSTFDIPQNAGTMIARAKYA